MQINYIETVKSYLLTLQQTLCDTFTGEESSSKKFNYEEWQYPQGGGGITRIIENGEIFEKAGVNFSHIEGVSLPKAATVRRPQLVDAPFEALGISMVLHPRNPYVPTMHANLRLVVVETNPINPVWWFGGGFDLTPYYPFDEDCIHWHRMAFEACKGFGENVYLKFKKACDDYFYLPHRQENRGIGGLFFDDLNDGGFEHSLKFCQSIGNHILLAYLPILQKRKNLKYSEREKQFQEYRRGRYVEFNLLYDRGTLFGLQSKGRTESILMSLPPQVSWKYNWAPEPGSLESELTEKYLIPRDWLKIVK